MKPTVTIKHGLLYRYYTCYKHLKYKTRESPYKNAPAELIERTVIDEVMKILKSPEVVMNLNRLAEEKQEISKSDLMAALKNLNGAWNYLYAVELAA